MLPRLNVRYARIQTRYCGKTGKPVGIFGACWHLLRAGKLTESENMLFMDIENWFVEHLPEPEFYKDGNPDKAITWFKTESADHMVAKLQPLMGLLEKYEVHYDIVFSNYPGRLIYEDEYQVAVI